MKFPELIFVRVPESDERRERIEQAVFAALGGEQPKEDQPPELFPLGSVATTTQLAAGSVATTTDAVAEPQPPPPLTLDGALPDHINVAVPANDARRDRIERDVFAQLGAIRTATRTDEIVAFKAKARWTPWLATASVAVAATIAVVMLWKRPAGPPVTGPQSPMEWKAPDGGTFTYGDAVMVAGKDTKVLASTAPDGTITLDLDRGSVDCDVEPRPGRAPFRVVAGDVRVEVIGTRFTVSRKASGVRVDVTRGKVKVRDQNGEYLVAAGETWPASLAAGSDIPDDAGTPEESELEMPEMPVGSHKAAKRTATPRDPSEAAYKQAMVLMTSDIPAAERAFQTLAKGNNRAARGALVWLSDIESDRGHTDAAIGYLDEHDRRFPNSTEAEEVAFKRIDVLKRGHRAAAAKDAARQYLQRFPQGTYVEQVTDMLRRR
jgi:transmembrane sensor